MTIETTHILLKRGNTAQSLTYTGPSGEVTVDTDLDSLRVHDGVTPGGTLLSGDAINGNRLVNGVRTLTLEATGNITAPAFTIPNSVGTNGQVLKWPSSGSTLVWGADSSTTNQLVNGAHTVSLGATGKLTFPDGFIIDTSTYTNTTMLFGAPNGEISTKNIVLSTGEITNTISIPGTVFDVATGAGNTDPVSISGKNGVGITTGADGLAHTQYHWTFGTDGTLTLPDSATLAVGSGAEIEALALVYTDFRDQLALAFDGANYTGDGWPADFTSYNRLTASADPDIQPSWIVLAKAAEDAYIALVTAEQSIGFNIDIYGRQWTFTSNRENISNSLVIPENTTISGPDSILLRAEGNANKKAEIELDAENNRVQILTTSTGWVFSNNGILSLPTVGKIGNGSANWTFSEGGSLTVPSPNSNPFTLGFTATNYVATGPKPTLTLTGNPWTVQGQYQYAANGDCELILAQIGPNLVNPGYESGDEFTFEFDVHGIVGHVLTIQLNSVVQAGPAGWTANAAASQPPVYPSSIYAGGAVKLTTNINTSWIFGTDGTLTLPQGSTINDTAGAPGNGNGQSVEIKPGGASNVNQLLKIYPTVPSPDGNHIHITSGDLAVTDLFLGNDDQFVQIAVDGKVCIGTYDTAGHVWQFGTDGHVTFPDGSIQTTAFTGLADSNIWIETFASDAPTYDFVQATTSVEYDLDGNIIALFNHIVPTNSNETYTSVAKLTPTGAVIWQVRFGTNLNTDGWGLAYDAVYNYIYLAGSTDGPGIYKFATLTKLSSLDGSLVWSKTYDFEADSQSSVVDVGQAGDPVMVGYAYNGTDNYIFTTRISRTDGSVVWCKTLNGQGYDQAYGMAVGPDSEVVTIGYVDKLLPTDSVSTAVTEPTSNVNWTTPYTNALTNGVNFDIDISAGVPTISINTDDTGNRVVGDTFATILGSTLGGQDGVDDMIVKVGTLAVNDDADRMVVIKYASDGVIAWQKAVQFDVGYNCSGADADIDTAGNIYVCGQYSFDTGNGDTDSAMNLIKFNSAGVKQWSRRVVGNCQTFATSVVLGDDGYLYLNGITGNNNTSDFIWVVAKYDTDGVVVWQRLIDKTTTWTFGGGFWFGSYGGGSNIAVRNGYIVLAGAFGDPGIQPTATIVQLDTDATPFSVGDWDITGATFSGVLNNTASDITVVDAGKVIGTVGPNVTNFISDAGLGNFLSTTRYSLTGSSSSIDNGAYSVSVDTNGVVTMVTSRGSLEFGALPEPGAQSHFHIMKASGDTADLFLGDDFNYVLQRGPANGISGYGVEIGTNDNNGGTQNSWRFGTDGTTFFPDGTNFGNINGSGTIGFAANVGSSFTVGTIGGSWEFGTDGNLTLPQGSTLGETTTTTIITPPGALAGQSLVIRPTNNWSLVASGYIVPGTNLTITLTSINGQTNGHLYTYTITGATAQQLGIGSLTGSFPALEPSDSSPQSAVIVLPIPSNSTVTTFTLDLDPAQPSAAGGSITVTNNNVVNNEPSHIHLVSGDPATVDLYLGDDDQYVKIEKNAGNVVIGTNTNTNHWTFGQTGTTTLPGAVVKSTVAKTGVPADTGIPVTLSGGMTGLGIADDTYGPFTKGNVTFEVTVSSGGISGYINISSTTSYAVNDTIGQLTSEDLGDAPGQTTNINVDAVDQGFTDMDLTKSVNKLADGYYYLADGVEGQIMYVVRQNGSTAANIFVGVANARWDGTVYSEQPVIPFQIPFTDMVTIIFTDGAWQSSTFGILT